MKMLIQLSENLYYNLVKHNHPVCFVKFHKWFPKIKIFLYVIIANRLINWYLPILFVVLVDWLLNINREVNMCYYLSIKFN